MAFIKRHVADSAPYKWPYDGQLRPDNTCFIVIDMQIDFCGKGGYVDCMGYDLSLTQAPIEPIKRVLAACRAQGYHIIHTREGHRPDLSDLPRNKQWRSEQIGAGIGSVGPCGRILTRGEPGWDIIPELAPLPGEPIIDKPGKGCFYATDLDLLLRNRGVRNLVIAGITTDVCVHTTMRDANDMGYECLLLTDGTGATDPANHAAAISMVQKQGGVFGAVATADQFIAGITAPAPHLAAPPPDGPTAVVSPARPSLFSFPLATTALLMIDFQRDFCCDGGFGSSLGAQPSLLRNSVPPAQRLLAAFRAAGLHVIHTMEAHKPDLSDLHANKFRNGNPPPGQRIGDAGPLGRILVAGEHGSGIIDELAPVEGEHTLFKPGKGSFCNTDLAAHLQARGITHLVIAGVTTECCVQTTMREANDRGYCCLLVTDATDSYTPAYKAAAIEMLTDVSAGGIGFGALEKDVTAALQKAKAAATSR